MHGNKITIVDKQYIFALCSFCVLVISLKMLSLPCHVYIALLLVSVAFFQWMVKYDTRTAGAVITISVL